MCRHGYNSIHCWLVWNIYPYSLGLLHWHWGNHMIAPWLPQCQWRNPEGYRWNWPIPNHNMILGMYHINWTFTLLKILIHHLVMVKPSAECLYLPVYQVLMITENLQIIWGEFTIGGLQLYSFLSEILGMLHMHDHKSNQIPPNTLTFPWGITIDFVYIPHCVCLFIGESSDTDVVPSIRCPNVTWITFIILHYPQRY